MNKKQAVLLILGLLLLLLVPFCPALRQEPIPELTIPEEVCPETTEPTEPEPCPECPKRPCPDWPFNPFIYKPNEQEPMKEVYHSLHPPRTRPEEVRPVHLEARRGAVLELQPLQLRREGELRLHQSNGADLRQALRRA